MTGVTPPLLSDFTSNRSFDPRLSTICGLTRSERTRRAKFDVATKQVSNTEGIAVMKRFEERLELLGKQREKDEETLSILDRMLLE